MKNGLIVLLTLLIAAILCTLVILPSEIKINESSTINVKRPAIYRNLADIANWSDWWPGQTAAGKFSLQLNDHAYSITDVQISSLSVQIEKDSDSLSASLVFIPVREDSTKLNWTATIHAGNNPIKRIQAYLSAREFRKDFTSMLSSIKNYYTSTEHNYGLPIERRSVKDSNLVFLIDSSIGYPTNAKLYTLIDELRNYVSGHSAKPVDSPMVNIYTRDSQMYQIKVALPTDVRMEGNGRIAYKWMLPHGNILVADVKGGPAAVEQAFGQVENYVHDYSLVAPAIPYYSLITNRLAETDSSKWVTRIYYPIMYFKASE